MPDDPAQLFQAATRAGTIGTAHVHQPDLLQAHRALLGDKYISSSDDAYFSIRKYYEDLRMWHHKHTGWRIERRNDLFCLMHQPSMLTTVSSAGESILKEPRDFVYVLWVLWYAANDQVAKRGNGQLFLLWQMLERLSEEWRVTRCIDMLTLDMSTDTSRHTRAMFNRRCMFRALQYLQAISCLKELDGQIDLWVEQDAPVLYQFTQAIHLFVASFDQQARDAVTLHQKAADIFTPTVLPYLQEKQTPLTRAWRTLLIGPSLLRFDDQEAFHALVGCLEEFQSELERCFGWSLEVNHDYACIIRDSSSPVSKSLLNPKRNSSDQIVLSFCHEIRLQVAEERLQPDYFGCIPTIFSVLLDLVASMRTRFEEYWGKGIREKSDKALLEEILSRMRHVGLVRGPDRHQRVLILPTAARYYIAYASPEVGTHTSEQGSETQQEKGWQQENSLWTYLEGTTQD